ncbi:MAG: hypothetical protein RI904_343, partial [Pseudomonadota bacterium]
MSALSQTAAWKSFSQAVSASPTKPDTLRILRAAELEVDLSTQRHSPALEKAAQALLKQQGFAQARADLFEGAAINWTENRAAWHTALRAPTPPAG